MRGVPPEVDQLMWAVAENPEPQAIAEFGERYPHFRAELMHRVNMVSGLRNQVRPNSPMHQERPQFQPRPATPAPNPRGLFLAGALGLAALAAASYTAYTVLHPEHRPIAQIVRQPAIEETPKYPEPKVAYKNPAPTPPPSQRDTQPPAGQAPRTEVPAYLKPRERVAFKDEDLTTALALVTQGTGIDLEVGPGFVDQKISVDYRGKTTVEILHDLASQYAFYISDEGNGTYLVLPVPDREAPASGRAKVGTLGTASTK